MIKRIFVTVFVFFAGYCVYAQDADLLLKEALDLEHQLQEPAALEKYKQVAAMQPKNIPVLVKCAELCCSIGGRQADKIAVRNFFDLAETYAQQAFETDSNNADANYAKALVNGKFTGIETDNKKTVSLVRDIYSYAAKALYINPNHARTNYILGKWHFEMTDLAWYKKVAVKAFYGALPEAEIDSAIKYMEKCRALDPYFVLNYLDLAKAYRYNDEPAKAIDVLNKLIRLPNRTADDASLKEEGKQLLEKLQ